MTAAKALQERDTFHRQLEKQIEALLTAKYDFETKIAASEMTVEEANMPDAVNLTYNPVTLDDLSGLSPHYPITGLLETAGMAESKLINLREPEWLGELNKLYTEENLEGIKAYLIDRIVSGYISYIDEEAYRVAQDITRKRNGITDLSSDEAKGAPPSFFRSRPPCAAPVHIRD